MSVPRARAASWLIGTGLVLILLQGCGSGTVRDTLLQATVDTEAAVRSGSLALRLLDTGAATRAVTETTFVDMTRQLASAQTSVLELDLSSAADSGLRDDTLAAVNAGTAAVLAGRDCVQLDNSCTPAEAALRRSGDRLAELKAQLEAGR
jgi:hypothetical protein